MTGYKDLQSFIHFHVKALFILKRYKPGALRTKKNLIVKFCLLTINDSKKNQKSNVLRAVSQFSSIMTSLFKPSKKKNPKTKTNATHIQNSTDAQYSTFLKNMSEKDTLQAPDCLQKIYEDGPQ